MSIASKAAVVAATWVFAVTAVPAYAATAANSQNGTSNSNAANESPPGTSLGAPDPAPAMKLPGVNGAGIVNGAIGNLPGVPAAPSPDAPK